MFWGVTASCRFLKTTSPSNFIRGRIARRLVSGCGACVWRWRRRVHCAIGEKPHRLAGGVFIEREYGRRLSVAWAGAGRGGAVATFRPLAGGDGPRRLPRRVGPDHGRVSPAASSRGKSREMSLGSIVDTRPIAGGDLSRTVGMFLAYYLVRRGPTAMPALPKRRARWRK